MKQMSFWCSDLKETSINPVFYFESGRTRTCNQTVMSGDTSPEKPENIDESDGD
jgi:hypothetical protein